WHALIADDHVDGVVLEKFQSHRATVGKMHFVVAAEQHPHRRQDARFVVDKQHSRFDVLSHASSLHQSYALASVAAGAGSAVPVSFAFCRTGNTILNSVPFPGLERTVIVPPWSSI